MTEHDALPISHISIIGTLRTERGGLNRRAAPSCSVAVLVIYFRRHGGCRSKATRPGASHKVSRGYLNLIDLLPLIAGLPR